MLRNFLFLLLLFAPSVSSAQEAPAFKTGGYIENVALRDLVSEEALAGFEGIMSADHEIAFNVYVPPSYDPAKPAGVLVFISPTIRGLIPGFWTQVMDRRNIIWVSVDGSGNNVSFQRRIVEALLSPSFIDRNYAIDPRRVYLSGFSGGGKTAHIGATAYPQLFKGLITFSGIMPWEETPPPQFDIIKQNHFVFIAGGKDAALKETKDAYRAYKKAGVENVKLMIVPGMDHRVPNTERFDQSIEFLDQGLGLPEPATPLDLSDVFYPHFWQYEP